MSHFLFSVISMLVIINFSSTHGSPVGNAVEEYPNDYYNDEEYYSDDDYDTHENESIEIFDATGNKETIVRRNPKFISQPKKIMVNEGDTIKLPCTVDKLDNFVIIWKKGSSIIAVGENFMEPDSRSKIEVTEHGNTLIYSLAEEGDSGEYLCQISALADITLKHTVKVRVRPEVVAAHPHIKVAAGQSAELECQVTRGSPEPEIVWKRQSRPFVGGQETMNGYSLIFPHTTRHHSGIYTCLADNGWGSPAEAQVHLEVQHKPEIEQEETFIHSRDGDEVEVVCIVHSSPASSVEWYRNGQLLDPQTSVITKRGNRHSLLIQKIGDMEIHGKYDCRAMNEFGEAMATTEVSGKAAPADFKSNPVSEKETEYTLEWMVASSTLVTEFNVEYRKADEADAAWTPLNAEVHKVGVESFAGKVMLHDLTPATNYIARVAAKNAYGFNSFSPNFSFSTYNKNYKVIQEKERASGAAASVVPVPPAAGDPKHEKSVSGAADYHSLSTCLGLLIATLLIYAR